MRALFLAVSMGCFLWTSVALAEVSEATIYRLGSEQATEVVAAIQEIGKSGDARALPALLAFRDGTLKVDDAGDVFLPSGDGGLVDALTQAPAKPKGSLRTVGATNVIRRTLGQVIARLELRSSDVDVRRKSAEELLLRPAPDMLDAMRDALAGESDELTRSRLALAMAKLELESDSAERRLLAVQAVGASGDVSMRPALERLVARGSDGSYLEPDPAVREAAASVVSSLKMKEMFIGLFADLFYGASLGSVLLITALGLAITFGVMGVINMAHGEMLMIGAYTTYVVQTVFQAHAPAYFDYYILLAIPCAFIVSMGVGVLLERAVIRFLYGRPLETLLATWGLSLLLIQSVRLLFGAQNVAVANPSWLSGGWEAMQGVVIPYSRLAIIGFVFVIVAFVWMLANRTEFGLRMRAVAQNRSMAACMGIPTGRVDMWTFGIGSGLAGLGGVALSQFANVGPELGQQYIVDSFMVVVLGGVGEIAGTVLAAFGVGFVNKLLEPIAGAVYGKILVLAVVILFIQKRPQGIFALKGRAAEG